MILLIAYHQECITYYLKILSLYYLLLKILLYYLLPITYYLKLILKLCCFFQ